MGVKRRARAGRPRDSRRDAGATETKAPYLRASAFSFFAL